MIDDKTKMLRRINAYDFALLDLQTYLDSHPADRRAMQLRQMYKKQRQELIGEYEMRFGPYVVTRDDVPDGDRWTWTHDPWPWDIQMEG